MSQPIQIVVLGAMPEPLSTAATTYLADTLHECRIVLSDEEPHESSAPLRELAASLVPDLEEIGDLLDGATVSVDQGLVTFEVAMNRGHSGTMAHLRTQFVQLRLLGRHCGLLVPSDPEVAQFLTWLWDESTDQLHGRPPRPYRLREI